MATSKTLTPTNVTISIPAMTDAPDQSVNSNCIDKLGDAVNTLNSNVAKHTVISQTGTDYTDYYEFPNGLVIMNKRVTVDVTITTPTGNIFYGLIDRIPYGITFASTPTITAICRANTTNGWIWENDSSTTTQSPSFFIGRGTSASGKVVIDMHVVGMKA